MKFQIAYDKDNDKFYVRQKKWFLSSWKIISPGYDRFREAQIAIQFEIARQNARNT